MTLSSVEQQVIMELEEQFSPPQRQLLASLRHWGDALFALLALGAVLVGIIVLAGMN